jgi:hypothetical protein
LAVTLVGWREVDGGKLTPVIAGSMELESVPPALVVLAEARNTLGNLVSVSSHQSADWQHGRVNETHLSCFDQELVKQPDHGW